LLERRLEIAMGLCLDMRLTLQRGCWYIDLTFKRKRLQNILLSKEHEKAGSDITTKKRNAPKTFLASP
jgi:hypothetical protein